MNLAYRLPDVTPKAKRDRKGTAEFYPLFDYLRIVLALGVFAGHADQFDVLPKVTGDACVQVFFALSGFLIGGILLKSTPHSLPRFYFNRSMRIWIPYALSIGLLFAVTLVKQGVSDPKFWEFFFYKVSFVYNVFGPPQLAEYVQRMPLQGTGNHLWSICVEEQFYLVAPFIIVFLRRSLLWVLIGIVAFHFFPAHYFTSISLGVLLALSREAFGDWYLRRPLGPLLVISVLIALLLLISQGWLSYRWGICPAAAATVALAARPGVENSLGRVLGGMSYSFYLNHWVGLFAANAIQNRLPVGALVSVLAGLSVALGLSWLHYLFIDRAIHDKRSEWYTRRRGLLACTLGLMLVTVGLVGGLILHLHPIT